MKQERTTECGGVRFLVEMSETNPRSALNPLWSALVLAATLPAPLAQRGAQGLFAWLAQNTPKDLHCDDPECEADHSLYVPVDAVIDVFSQYAVHGNYKTPLDLHIDSETATLDEDLLSLLEEKEEGT